MSEGREFTFHMAPGHMAELLRAAERDQMGNKWDAQVMKVLLILSRLGWLLPGLLLGAFVGRWMPASQLTNLTIFGFGIAGLVAAQWFCRRQGQRYIERSFGRFLDAPRSWHLDAEAITMSGRHGSWRTAWTGVDGLYETDRIIVVRIAGMVFALPKEAIGSEADRVLREMQGWWRAALDADRLAQDAGR